MLTWLSPSPPLTPSPSPTPSLGYCPLDLQPGLPPGSGRIGLGALQAQLGEKVEIFQWATYFLSCPSTPPASLPEDALEKLNTPADAPIPTPWPVYPPSLPPSTVLSSPVFWGRVWRAVTQAQSRVLCWNIVFGGEMGVSFNAAQLWLLPRGPVSEPAHGVPHGCPWAPLSLQPHTSVPTAEERGLAGQGPKATPW